MIKKTVVLAVHGGAGIILRSSLTPELERDYRAGLEEAMAAGHAILLAGGKRGEGGGDERRGCSAATDAVEAAVRCLEDCPLFNAGRGSVFRNDGRNMMDASIMACSYPVHVEDDGDGGREETAPRSRAPSAADESEPDGPHQIIQKRRHPAVPQPTCGAVAGVRNVKNPISLARAVMDRTPHVMLVGKGAEEFARSLPEDAMVESEPDEYFWTERRWDQLVEVRKSEAEQMPEQSKEKAGKGSSRFVWKQTMKVQLDHADESKNEDVDASDHRRLERKFGTVGCVALYRPDEEKSSSSAGGRQKAQLASATSTGGLTNARFDRVGDSPIIGAGTNANRLCAISCTGHGEHFVRCVAAHDMAKRLEYKHGYGGGPSSDGGALQRSAEEVILGTLMGDGKDDEGGDGGVIALDRDGNFVAELNCPGMYHGWVYEDGTMETRIFWDE